MRYWPTLVLVLVLAGLGLYLYAVELPQKESHERQDTADKKVLLFDQDTLSGLTIKTDRHELVFARTPDRGWVLTAPLNTEADQREVQNLIRALVTGTVTRTVEDHPTNLTPFGLDNPVTTITVIAGATHGRPSPSGIAVPSPLPSMSFVNRIAKCCSPTWLPKIS